MPKRLASEPAATLRTTTSSGMISTSRTSCSRMLRRRTKWVGTPISSSFVIRYSEMRLLSTPLPVMVPFFWLLKAVASSLKYWTSVPGLRPFEQDLGLAFVNAPAAGHPGSPVLKNARRDQAGGRGRNRHPSSRHTLETQSISRVQRDSLRWNFYLANQMLGAITMTESFGQKQQPTNDQNEERARARPSQRSARPPPAKRAVTW